MSLGLWQSMIKPHHIHLSKALHQFDANGMDPLILKHCYGERLCFHGGISVQKTLPFGSPDDAIREVKFRFDVLGRQGGYILASSHANQAGTPPENIVALLDTAKSYRSHGSNFD